MCIDPPSASKNTTRRGKKVAPFSSVSFTDRSLLRGPIGVKVQVLRGCIVEGLVVLQHSLELCCRRLSATP